jgi:hypothetical protein
VDIAINKRLMKDLERAGSKIMTINFLSGEQKHAAE